jgi:IS605 OrfB family transposase
MLVTANTKLNSSTSRDHKIRISNQYIILKEILKNINQEKNLLMKKIHMDDLMETEKELLCDYLKTPETYYLHHGSRKFSAYIDEITSWKHDAKSRISDHEEIISNYKIIEKQDLKTTTLSRNTAVSEWEMEFHKDLRTNAVKKVCNSYKTAGANLKAGNIKSYNIDYMKSKDPRKCMELSAAQLSIKNKNIHLPSFKGHPTLKVSKKMSKKLNNVKISNNCDFVHQKNSYWILIPVAIQIPQLDINDPVYCGVDPGIVKISTTFGKTEAVEYTHNRELLKRYNQKIILLKNMCIRKKQINKIEKKKIDYTNRLHWSLIKYLLDDNDVVFFGDIKSHDIVKDGKNRSLNQEFNDLKFYILKQRLIYKAKTRGKKVILVNEMYTSMTCSNCGNVQKMENRIYECKSCNSLVDRDINAAKNILMKGILSM